MNAFSTKNFLAYESCMTSQSLDEAMESLHYDTGDGCKYHPVFVILLNCKTTFDKIAGKLVKGQMYWHAAISFGPSLSSVYSFNFGEAEANKLKGGLSYESLAFYQREHPTGEMYVGCIFLTQYRYKKMKAVLNHYIENKKKTKYSFSNLLFQFFNKNKESKTGLDKVCSTFVDTLLKSVDVNLNDRPTDLVKPDHLREGNEMQIKIYEGPISGYDPMKAAKLVEKMANDKSYSYFKRTSSQHSKSGQKKNQTYNE